MEEYEDAFERIADLLSEEAKKKKERIHQVDGSTRKLLDDAERRNAELAEEIQCKKSAWLRFLVTTSSVLCGILVALGDNSSLPRHIRVLYALGAFLLILSILLLSGSLYSESYYAQQRRRLYNEEARKSLRESRPLQTVRVPRRVLFSIFEVAGYICFSLALLFLGVYMLLWALL